MDTKKIRDVCSATFYVVLIFATIVFVVNYAFVDWEKVSEEMDSAVDKLLDSVHCEIDYKDFHYKGMCTDRQEIFDFLQNTTGSPQGGDV